VPESGPAELTQADHRARAGEAVDRALDAVEATPWLAGRSVEAGELRDRTPDELRSVIVVLTERVTGRPSILDRLRGGGSHGSRSRAAAGILGSIGRRSISWTRGDAVILLTILAEALDVMDHGSEWIVISAVRHPVVAAEAAVKAGGLSGLEGPIGDVVEGLGRFEQYSRGQAARYRSRLAALLEAAGGGVDPNLFDLADTFGRDWADRAADLPVELRPLLTSLALVSSVVPSAAWRNRAAELVQAPGAGPLLGQLIAAAPASRTLRAPTVYTYGDQRYELAAPAIGDQNVNLVRGAVWAAAILDEPWAPDALLALGLHFGTSGRSDNVARDERLANAAAAALGSLDDAVAFAALGRLKAKVTNRNVSKQIARALAAAALRAGISPSELLELAVATHGLDAAGRREIPIGDHAAILAVDGDDATLTWRDPRGRIAARPAAGLAETHRAGVARARDDLKELRRGLAVERGRIEDLFVEDRDWAIGDWRARYLEHPLTRTVGRRLIWMFAEGDGPATAAMVEDDGLVAADGSVVAPGVAAHVRLWHPIDAPEAEIAAWRARLLDRRIRQPFKQAFREVYLVTPAEQATEVYSNRFAGHILRYPQARALMTARRWGSNFLGPFDGGDTAIARRDFPSHGIRAEFWHGQLEAEFGIEAVQHCTTDQVRFLRPGPPEELIAVGDVPPRVFSEAMRDVDLFVSVTSVGSDRNWQDGGRRAVPPLDGYWTDYWTGDLSATAQVRRDAIERLLPGLAIADRLALDDRWLVVRGDLRTYRIHLGSGNILMEPSDTYLCIVPARGSVADRVFLPFDDDPTLSVILSKAFLLAADRRITDDAIVRQIRRS